MLQLHLASLVAVALLGSGCASSAPVPAPAPAGDPPVVLTAPDGMRLAAFHGVALAVPDDWGTEVFDGCGRTPDGTVVFRMPGRPQGCGQAPDRGRSWIVLETFTRGVPGLGPVAGGRVDGMRVLRSGLSCRRDEGCDQILAVPSRGVLVRLHVRGPASDQALRTMRAALRLVPDGWTEVPPIAFGTSDEDALAALEEVGLEGRLPEVDWPHYVTGSSPPPGTVVEDGSVIDLTIGDG